MRHTMLEERSSSGYVGIKADGVRILCPFWLGLPSVEYRLDRMVTYFELKVLLFGLDNIHEDLKKKIISAHLDRIFRIE